MEKAIINDLNGDLINVYRTIALQPEELISILDILQKEYHLLEDDEDGIELARYPVTIDLAIQNDFGF